MRAKRGRMRVSVQCARSTAIQLVQTGRPASETRRDECCAMASMAYIMHTVFGVGLGCRTHARCDQICGMLYITQGITPVATPCLLGGGGGLLSVCVQSLLPF